MAASTKKITKEQNNAYSLRIPKPKIGLTQGLVLILIVGAFLMGSLVTKISLLEQQVNNAPQATTAQASAQQAVPGQQQALQPPAGKQNVAVGNYPPLGNPNAKVTVIEFADFRCPFCEQWFQTVEPNLIKDYVNTGKVKFYFRNYAFLGPASTLAANAGECANEQGKFWQFHDYMYSHQPSESDTSMYTVANLSQIAGNLGMNQSQFQSCLSSNKYNNNVTKDLNDGSAAGVNGTPTTFINGIPIVGAVPYSQIKAEIDKALQ